MPKTSSEGLFEFLSELIKNQPLLLIILGLLLFVVGAAGGLPYWQFAITEPHWRYACAILGLVVAAAGGMLMWLMPASGLKLNTSKFGFKISQPAHKDIVPMHEMHYVVRGTHKKKPPENYAPYIIEIEYHGNERKYRPRKLVVIEDSSWRATGVWGGDKPNIERTIAVALVGAGGQSLFKYYELVGETYKYERRPALSNLPPDVFLCDEIRFTTGHNLSPNANDSKQQESAATPTVTLPNSVKAPSPKNQFKAANEQIARDTEAALSSVILRTRYKFVFNPLSGQSKTLTFLPNGHVGEGQNNNEATWRIADGCLEIFDSLGNLYSRFTLAHDGQTLHHTNEAGLLSLKGQFMVPIG